MNYNHLYYFHVIAQEGSLARASRRLNVSQPTLSEQLKQLELFFKCKLFDRKGGTLRINENGRRTLEITEDMFHLGDRLLESFETSPDPAKKRVEVGVVVTAARSLTTDRFVNLFRDEEVLVRVRHGDNQFLLHELVGTGLDILITESLPQQAKEKGVISARIPSPPFVLIAHRELAASFTSDTVSSLHNQPFIHYTTQSTYRWEIDQYFRNQHIEPTIIAEADDVYVIRDAVAENLGFGVVPQRILDDGEINKDIAVIGRIERDFPIYALYNDKEVSSEIKAAIDVLTAD